MFFFEKGDSVKACTQRGYWLMKSEPHVFSWEDLKASPGKTTCWDGVRNYQARNYLRDTMRPGDGVLFYHSNIKEPAIVGVAQVVRGGYPDHTALDPRSDHFDPRASAQNPIWYMVDVMHLADLRHPLSRDDLRRHPLLADMAVLHRGNRLSVQPVSQQHWQLVLQLGEISAAEQPSQFLAYQGEP